MALRLHQWHRALLQANPLLARYGRACGVGRPAHDEPGTQQEAGARSSGMTRSTACRGPAAKACSYEAPKTEGLAVGPHVESDRDHIRQSGWPGTAGIGPLRALAQGRFERGLSRFVQELRVRVDRLDNAAVHRRRQECPPDEIEGQWLASVPGQQRQHAR